MGSDSRERWAPDGSAEQARIALRHDPYLRHGLLTMHALDQAFGCTLDHQLLRSGHCAAMAGYGLAVVVHWSETTSGGVRFPSHVQLTDLGRRMASEMVGEARGATDGCVLRIGAGDWPFVVSVTVPPGERVPEEIATFARIASVRHANARKWSRRDQP